MPLILVVTEDAAQYNVGDLVSVNLPTLGLKNLVLPIIRKRWCYGVNGEYYQLELQSESDRPEKLLIDLKRELDGIQRLAQNKTTVRDQECPMF